MSFDWPFFGVAVETRLIILDRNVVVHNILLFHTIIIFQTGK